MRARVRVYPVMLEVAAVAQVREALKTEAERIARRAEQIANADGVNVAPTVEEGTRPRGRPYAQVRSNDADVEFGSYGVRRRRILGRAAGI